MQLTPESSGQMCYDMTVTQICMIILTGLNTYFYNTNLMVMQAYNSNNSVTVMNMRLI